MTVDGREVKICPIATLDFRDDDGKALLISGQMFHVNSQGRIKLTQSY
jgi:hypothetical protein